MERPPRLGEENACRCSAARLPLTFANSVFQMGIARYVSSILLSRYIK